MTTTEDKLRADFEAKLAGALNFRRSGDTYSDHRTTLVFDLWKGAKALSAPPSPAVPPADEDLAEIERFMQSVVGGRVGHFGTWTGYTPQIETGWAHDVLERVRRLAAQGQSRPVGEPTKEQVIAVRAALHADQINDLSVGTIKTLIRVAMHASPPAPTAQPATAGAQPVEQGWRPISSAPKGHESLLWTNGFGEGGHVALADWGDYCDINAPKFTYWMPLPAPPLPEQDAPAQPKEKPDDE